VLGGSDQKYGVIISEPSNPWFVGVERLYTSEFYSLAKSRLNDDGIYCQWFHGYSMSEKTLGMILNTFRSVFPRIRIFQTNNDFIILGSEKDLKLKTLIDNFSFIGTSEELKVAGIDSIEALLSRELWLNPAPLRYAGVHSLLRPRLAFQAAKDFFYNVDIQADSLDASYDRLPLYSLTAAKSLSAEWLALHSNNSGLIREFAKTWCGLATPELLSGWDKAPKQCRDSLVALAVLGEIEPAYGLTDRKIKLLKLLTVDSGNAVISSDNDAYELVKLYYDFASIFLPFSQTVLKEAFNRCFEAKNAKCLAQAVEAFAFAVEPEKARALFSVANQSNLIDSSFEPQIKRIIGISSFAESLKVSDK
jgi:hypothetical protein